MVFIWYAPVDLRAIAWMESKGAWMIAYKFMQGFVFRPFKEKLKYSRIPMDYYHFKPL